MQPLSQFYISKTLFLQKNYYIFIILPEMEITMRFEVLTEATVFWDMIHVVREICTGTLNEPTASILENTILQWNYLLHNKT